jgi:hypothetical protein
MEKEGGESNLPLITLRDSIVAAVVKAQQDPQVPWSFGADTAPFSFQLIDSATLFYISLLVLVLL